jgi:hypothetical protein
MTSSKPHELPDFLDRSRQIRWIFPSTMEVLLEYLVSYVSTMEDLLEAETSTIQKRYEADQYAREYFEDPLFVAKALFLNLLRGSFFLTTYALVEDGLKRKCLCIEKTERPPKSLEEYRAGGGYIYKYKKYLKEQAEIDVEKIAEWNALPIYGQLRNRVVHNRGLLNPNNTDLMSFIKANPNLDSDNDEIVFKKGFCEEAIETIRRFFQELDTQLPIECQDLEPHFGFRP